MAESDDVQAIRDALTEIAASVAAQLDLVVSSASPLDDVARRDEAIDERCRTLEADVMQVRARWPSVYGQHGRWLAAAAIQAVALERVGNLAVEIARRSQQMGSPPDPDADSLARTLRRAGVEAVEAFSWAAASLGRADSDRARQARARAQAASERITALEGRVQSYAGGGRRWASEALLVARCLERVAANAAALAAQTDWVLTGERL